jgi:hypothetical protein
MFFERDYLVDFMGFVIPYKMYCNPAYLGQPVGHAIRARQCEIHDKLSGEVSHVAGKRGRNAEKEMIPLVEKSKRTESEGDDAPILQTQWPVVSEEYFEYADVLDAVTEYTQLNEKQGGNRPFAFVEIGAGYGHWTFAAHRALMQKCSGASYKYLLVDVAHALIPWVKELATLNEVKMTDDRDSGLYFHIGFVGTSFDRAKDLAAAKENEAAYTRKWGLKSRGKHEPSPPVFLKDLLAAYDMPCVLDMVDVDIQKAEYDLFADDKTVDILTARARRLHIGTHSSDYQKNKAIEEKFTARGWTTKWFFLGVCCDGRDWLDTFGRGKGKRYTHFPKTPLGQVSFNDGVLSLLNPNSLQC